MINMVIALNVLKYGLVDEFECYSIFSMVSRYIIITTNKISMKLHN